jgi:hypothetical protein
MQFVNPEFVEWSSRCKTPSLKWLAAVSLDYAKTERRSKSV